jgi:two-component system response regulator CpxR
VLVLDDDSVVADSLVSVLSANGYDARCTYDAETAIRTAALWSPAAFIADIFLPDMTGVQAASRIFTANPHCRLMFISGDPRAVELLMEPHGRPLYVALAKPIHPDHLLAALRLVMAGDYDA